MNFCFSGTAGDSLRLHNGKKFTTKDVENDIDSEKNCAQFRPGAWWFTRCLRSHLNGEYLGGGHNQPFKGIVWTDFKGQEYSYKGAEMKVRRDEN